VTEKLPYAKRYQDLIAYKKSMGLADIVFQETKSFSKEEIYSLTDQLKESFEIYRSSNS